MARLSSDRQKWAQQSQRLAHYGRHDLTLASHDGRNQTGEEEKKRGEKKREREKRKKGAQRKKKKTDEVSARRRGWQREDENEAF